MECSYRSSISQKVTRAKSPASRWRTRASSFPRFRIPEALSRANVVCTLRDGIPTSRRISFAERDQRGQHLSPPRTISHIRGNAAAGNRKRQANPELPTPSCYRLSRPFAPPGIKRWQLRFQVTLAFSLLLGVHSAGYSTALRFAKQHTSTHVSFRSSARHTLQSARPF